MFYKSPTGDLFSVKSIKVLIGTLLQSKQKSIHDVAVELFENLKSLFPARASRAHQLGSMLLGQWEMTAEPPRSPTTCPGVVHG